MNSLGRLARSRAAPGWRPPAPARIVRHVAGGLRPISDLAPSGPLKKTPLYDLQVGLGAKMVPFAGYQMPVQYDGQSLADSHRFTRAQASLFDVSHMVQHRLRGPGAAAFLERVTPSSWAPSQAAMQGKLTTLLWPETGGIVDDAVVTRLGPDDFHMVTNGACLDKDVRYLDEQLGRFGGAVEWTHREGRGLVALQGPGSAEILGEALADDLRLDTLYFGGAAWARLRLADGTTKPVLITRGGYTGEDGFEMALGDDDEEAVRVVEALLVLAGPERLRMAGLGARDSLRLEAGMCLYGHDLDDSVTPVEAGLAWIIPPERRSGGGRSFHGAERILAQLVPRSKGGTGVERRRVGFVVEGAPAREGAEVLSDGERVGVVTSGVPSPTLGKNIAMGYIRDGLHKAGTVVDVVVRGRKRSAVVTKMPFVPTKYWRAP